MVNYREILRLHSLKYPQRDIAASVHSSRSTVHEVISIASQLEISWPLDPEVTDAVLETLLYPERAEKQTDRMPEYYGAAEPPVRCGESHLSGLTEPPHLFCY